MTDYYVDKTLGDDGWSGEHGTQQNGDGPWETVDKVNGETYSAGDSILFKKDEEWREQLTIPSSGSSGSVITFGAYGSGADPIINGSDLVATWTEYLTTETWGENTADDHTSVTGDTFCRGEEESGNNFNEHADELFTRYYDAPSQFWRKGFLSFDLSALSGTVTDATITLNINLAPTENMNIELWSCDDAFVEATATWDTYDGSNAWTGTHGKNTKVDTLVLTQSQTGDVTFNALALTTYINAQAGGTAYFVLEPYSAVSGAYAGFHDSESGDDGDRPTISITTGVANVWKATLTTEPNRVFFDDTLGTNEASAAACTSEFDWFWDSNVLYVYSTGDPDDDYTSPGIEASKRDYGIDLVTKDYITVDNLTVSKTNSYGVLIQGSEYITAQYVDTRYCALHGFMVIGWATNDDVNNVSINDCSDIGSYVGVSVGNWGDAPTPAANIVIRRFDSDAPEHANFVSKGAAQWLDCRGTNAGWAGFRIGSSDHEDDTADGVVIKRAWIEGAAHDGIFFMNTKDEGNQLLAYSVILNCGIFGLDILDGGHGGNPIKVYNNIFYSNRTGSQDNIIRDDNNSGNQTMDVRNNIFYSKSGQLGLTINLQVGDVLTLDNNLYWSLNDTASDNAIAITGGGTYTFTEVDDGTFYAAEGYEEHGIGQDPKLIDHANDDFGLADGSPCINAGTHISYIGIDSATSVAGSLTVTT